MSVHKGLRLSLGSSTGFSLHTFLPTGLSSRTQPLDVVVCSGAQIAPFRQPFELLLASFL